MSGAMKTADAIDWQFAHLLWQKHGLRMEEYAEMPRNVQLAYIASYELAKEYPVKSTDKLAHVYIKSE